MPFTLIALGIIILLVLIVASLTAVIWLLNGRLHNANAHILQLQQELDEQPQQRTVSRFAAQQAALTPPDETAPLAEKLDFLLKSLTPGTLVRGETAVAGTPTPLSTNIETELLNIVEEAAVNALRHAKPSKIVVSLDYRQPDRLTLRMVDNGKGFDPQNPIVGYGLTGLREKGMRVNGRLAINLRPEGGTELVCTVPLEN